jgi:hypothetical protein
METAHDERLAQLRQDSMTLARDWERERKHMRDEIARLTNEVDTERSAHSALRGEHIMYI